MANSEPRAPAALRVLTLMILIFLAISQWLGEQARFNGVDFYQLWGVGAAQKLSGHSLGSPYTERERYAVVLNDYAGTVDYPSLTTASAVWKRLALTATPLLYVSFSMLPRDYSVAIGLFRGRAGSTARRRNSGGLGAGIPDFPRRPSPSPQAGGQGKRGNPGS